MASTCMHLKDVCLGLGWTDPEEGFAWSRGRIRLYFSTFFVDINKEDLYCS